MKTPFLLIFVFAAQLVFGQHSSNTTGALSDPKTKSGVTVQETSGISIAPNPSTGIFQIFTQSPITDVKVYDATGKCIAIEQEDKDLVDLTGYPPGFYLMQIKIGEKVFTHKVIVR